MSAFNVWNPDISTDSNSVAFVVTNGDVSGMARDRGFVSELLREVQVDEAPESWTITRCRSKYYSEYLDSTEWQDTWQVVWRVTVTTATAIKPKRRKRPVLPWREANISGEDWIEESPGNVMCLAVSDFSSEAAMMSSQNAVLDDAVRLQMEDRYSVAAPAFGYTRVLGKYHQLQILLGEFGDDFYRQGADYAEHVLRICQVNRGTANATDRRK